MTMSLLASIAAEYLKANGRPVTSTPLKDAESLLSAPRCGFPDALASNDVCFWAHGRNGEPVRVFSSLLVPQFGRVVTDRAVQSALESWEAVCGVRFQMVTDVAQANIVIQGGRIDGAGGTLGYAYFPCGASRTDSRLILIDTDENWPSVEYLLGTLVHEVGHAIGLPHDSNPASIMFWQMRLNGPYRPTPVDEPAIQLRYPQRPQPVPTPTPVPTPAPQQWIPDGWLTIGQVEVPFRRKS